MGIERRRAPATAAGGAAGAAAAAAAAAAAPPKLAAAATLHEPRIGVSPVELEASRCVRVPSRELRRLVSRGGGAPPRPLHAAAKRWGAGFAAGTLGLKEDCVSLEPWRLAIAGDFLADRASPVEAAALSGMEAGERIAKWFPTSKL